MELVQAYIYLEDKNGDEQKLTVEGEYCDYEGVLNYSIEFAGIEFEPETLTAHFLDSAEHIEYLAVQALKEEGEKQAEIEYTTRNEFAGNR